MELTWKARQMLSLPFTHVQYILVSFRLFLDDRHFGLVADILLSGCWCIASASSYLPSLDNIEPKVGDAAERRGVFCSWSDLSCL